MKFRILGPLEVVGDDGLPVVLGGPQRQVLLTALLLDANRVVSISELKDAIWGSGSPDKALATLRTHISELRRLLGHAVLERVNNGYVLRLADGQTDEAEARALLEAGRQVLGDDEPDRAARLFEEALALWRGASLTDVADRGFAAKHVVRLDELRADVLKCKIDADLRRGRHRDVIGDLRGLVDTYPADEGLRRRLALALYYDERPEEAAQVCRDGLEVLYDQGLDSAALKELQNRILNGAVEPLRRPDAGPTVRAADPPASQGVSQLPQDVSNFTGREHDLTMLLELLAPDGAPPPGAVVSAIAGKPGVGKTALAIHAAHRLRSVFPDAVLYVDLHGNEHAALQPERVLSRFLNALGLARSTLPVELDELTALYRERLSGMRVLVVLDNAASESQVRPLLPGVAGCAAVVTSRRRLSGLNAEHRLINVLRPEHAVQLLGKVAGRERVEAEAEDAQAIVGLCGYLPLAVCIAGSKLASRPFWRLAKLAQRLTDERDRLDVLEIGDLEVRASFALSYDERPEFEQQAFRLLGLIDAPDFAAWVGAALLDLDLDDAEEILELLSDAQLLERLGEDLTGQLRYRFHDLLRVYAREKADEEETEDERRGAVNRALWAYQVYARRAADRFAPGDTPLVEPASRPAWRVHRTAIDAVVHDPVLWYGVERLNFLAVIPQAAQDGYDELTWLLSTTLADLFEISANWADWEATHGHALTAARRAGDPLAEAWVLCKLGRRSAVIAQERSAWRLDVPREDIEAGRLPERSRDEFLQSQQYYERAKSLYQSLGHELGVAVATSGIGDALTGLREAVAGVALYEQALPVFARLGRQVPEAFAHARLGVAYGELKQFDDAVTCLTSARSLARDTSHRWLLATALRQLGDLRRAQERHSDALGCYEEAIPLLHALPDPLWEARVRTHHGDILWATDEPARAREQWTAAEELLRSLGSSEVSAVEERQSAPDPAPTAPRPGEVRRLIRLPHDVVIDLVAESRRAIRFTGTWSDLYLGDRAEPALAALRSALERGAMAQILLTHPDSEAAAARSRQVGKDVAQLVRENIAHLSAFAAAVAPHLATRLAVRLQDFMPTNQLYRIDSTAFVGRITPAGNTAHLPQIQVSIDHPRAQDAEEQMDELWGSSYAMSMEDYLGVELLLNERRGPSERVCVDYVEVDGVKYVTGEELCRRLREDDIDRVALVPRAETAEEVPAPRTVFLRADTTSTVSAAFERKYGNPPGEVLRLDTSQRL